MCRNSKDVKAGNVSKSMCNGPIYSALLLLLFKTMGATGRVGMLKNKMGTRDNILRCNTQTTLFTSDKWGPHSRSKIINYQGSMNYTEFNVANTHSN